MPSSSSMARIRDGTTRLLRPPWPTARAYGDGCSALPAPLAAVPVLHNAPHVALRRADHQRPHQQEHGKLPGRLRTDDQPRRDVFGHGEALRELLNGLLQRLLEHVQ